LELFSSPEVRHVAPHDVAQEPAEHAGGLDGAGAGFRHVDGVVAPVGQAQVGQERAAVGVRIGAHPPRAGRVQVADGGHRPAGLVEELLGAVAAQPVLEHAAVPVVLPRVGEGHLVRAPRALDRQPVDLGRAGPPLG
jgi:hypothetical protein